MAFCPIQVVQNCVSFRKNGTANIGNIYNPRSFFAEFDFFRHKYISKEKQRIKK